MGITAIIPAAGLGTRFLPVSRAVSKELLPILTKPVLQFLLEELADAGIFNVVIVTREGKDDIRNFCDPSQTKYDQLLQRGYNSISELRELLFQFSITWVTQNEPQGLGHAVICAQSAVQDDWVLVLLPDVIIDSEVGCSRQMLEAHQKIQRPIIATHRAKEHLLSNSGVLDIAASESDRCLQIRRIVEKPAPGEAPSNWIVSGRYLLPRDIFKIIYGLSSDKGQEIELTNALNVLNNSSKSIGYVFDGHQMDTGNVAGWLAANLYFAQKDPKIDVVKFDRSSPT